MVKIIATFFYIGYLPIRGTLASALVSLCYFFFLKENTLTYILVTVTIGFLVSGRAERIYNQKDASEIVIDDASGMLVALFLVPAKLNFIIAAFFLYRLLDIIKPPPIKKLENLRGASGVMLDDITAGIYTNIILQAIHYTLK